MNITGRLTRDAEVRTTSQDKQVVNFSVAINASYRNKQGERIEQTIYFDCSYWISTKVARFLTKGTLVELTGRASSSGWIGKDGEIKSGLNFHTSNIKVHGGGKKSDTDEQPASQPQKSNVFAEDTDDDLPF